MTPCCRPPDPKLFATYDETMGAGTPGDGVGARKQGAKNVVEVNTQHRGVCVHKRFSSRNSR